MAEALIIPADVPSNRWREGDVAVVRTQRELARQPWTKYERRRFLIVPLPKDVTEAEARRWEADTGGRKRAYRIDWRAMGLPPSDVLDPAKVVQVPRQPRTAVEKKV